MIDKLRLPEVTVQATIDINNEQLKKNSKIPELFLQSTIDIPASTKSSYEVIKFEPVKTGRPDDIHLYLQSQDPSLMKQIELKEGHAEDQSLLNLDKFLCHLQNALYADYIRINCSEGIVIYQSVGETEVKKIDLTKIENGKYISEFHKIQDDLRQVIDENEGVEYIERKAGLRGMYPIDQFSPPLTERFSTLHRVIIPRLLMTIKSEPKKVAFLEKIIFIDSLIEELMQRSSSNLDQAHRNFQDVQQTPSDPRFSEREQQLQEAKKDCELINQLNVGVLYTMAAYMQNTDDQGHIGAAREIEKFLSSNLATMGQKSWEHQESFPKKAISWMTRNRLWAELPPLTEEEREYAYRMGALSLPAGDRVLYKEYIQESGKEVPDMPTLQVLIEVIRQFPDDALCEYKGLVGATPYNFLGIQDIIQRGKEVSLYASHDCITSDELLQHIKNK